MSAAPWSLRAHISDALVAAVKTDQRAADSAPSEMIDALLSLTMAMVNNDPRILFAMIPFLSDDEEKSVSVLRAAYRSYRRNAGAAVPS